MTRMPKSAALRSWGKKQEKQLRSEVEFRFKNRTPPRTPDEVDPAHRVPRTEIVQLVRGIVEIQGVRFPDLYASPGWLGTFTRWYGMMSRRIQIAYEAEQEEKALNALDESYRRHSLPKES